jgi:hypothetical protein
VRPEARLPGRFWRPLPLSPWGRMGVPARRSPYEGRRPADSEDQRERLVETLTWCRERVPRPPRSPAAAGQWPRARLTMDAVQVVDLTSPIGSAENRPPRGPDP